MSREIFTFLLAVTSTGTLQPAAVWKALKHWKKILEFIGFIGQFPKWIGYYKNLEENLQFLKRKMEYLETVQADIETELEETEPQSGRKRKREVSHWLRSVRSKAVDVRNFEDAIDSVRFMPRLLYRAWLGSCIGKEIEQVNELAEQGLFPTGLLLDAALDCGGPLVTSELKGGAVAQKMDEMWGHLLNPVTVRIGIQGPQGIGKSAIILHIFNRLYSFCHTYYVSIPEEFSIYGLQDCIAKAMKVNLPQTGSEIRRAARICQVLKSMKEFVLILDGLSSQGFALEDVGIPMDGNEGKLIITSRSPDVCRMLCQETVVLESLGREDSEILFMEELAVDGSLPDELRDVAAYIIQKCNGIPSKIKEMAVQLRGVSDLNDWMCILCEM